MGSPTKLQLLSGRMAIFEPEFNFDSGRNEEQNPGSAVQNQIEPVHYSHPVCTSGYPPEFAE